MDNIAMLSPSPLSPYIIPGLKFRDYSTGNVPIPDNFNRIVNLILDQTVVRYDNLFMKDRRRHISDARMLCMWAIRRNTSATFTSIGDFFAMDHTTVVHACQTIDKRIAAKDYRIMEIIEKVKPYL